MLLPILRGRVHSLLAAAGQGARAIQRGPKTLAVDSFEGFTVFDIDAQRLLVKFVDTDGKIRCETEIQ